jgi:hypothetical protein
MGKKATGSDCPERLRPDRVRHGYLDADTRAGLRSAFHLAPAAKDGDAFPHANEADALAGTGVRRECLHVEASARVLDFQMDVPSPVIQRYAHPRGLGVLAHVGQRLLGHAEEGGLNNGR